MYQTTDLVFFSMIYIVNKHYTKFIICMFLYQISLSSKNNKNQPIKALELHIKIVLQNMHEIYFSYKVNHIIRLTNLESYFSELPMIYYAFSNKIAITRIK
jgi:hypothetical protein